MDRNRRNKKYNNWNNQRNSDSQNNKKNQNDNNQKNQKEKTFQFNHTIYENEENEKQRQKSILEIKAREVKCAVCGQLITDIASSIADKNTGNPVHFECVLKKLEETEKIGENEKIAYIGQGRFGVLYYENIRDQKKFTIKKIIEVEDREKQSLWRTELGDLYSKVN